MKNIRGSASTLGLLLTLPAAALFAGQAHAQSTGQDSQPVQLQTITVNAAGDWLGEADPEVVRTHAGGRGVVRQEQFEQSGASTVTEAIRAIPGVQAPPNNGTGSADSALNIGIRGMTSRLSAGTTLLLDGVPMSVAPYGQPETSLAGVSLGMLQAIDVVKGGGSVRYGPNISGGVVNFVTKDIPTTPYGGEISLRGDSTLSGSDGRMNGKTDLLFGGSLENGTGLAVLYSGNHGEGFRENHRQDIDDFMLKGRFALTENSRLEARIHHYYADVNLPGPLNLAAYRADPYQSTHSRERFLGERDEYVVKYVNEFNGDYRLETTAFHTNAMREFTLASNSNTAVVGGGSDATANRLERLPRNYSVYGFEPRFTALAETGSVKHAMSVGYRYMTESTDERQMRRTFAAGGNPFGAPEVMIRSSTGSTEAHAVYVDDAVKIGTVTVTPGLRFEKVEVDRTNMNGGFRDTEEYNEPLPSLRLGWEATREWFGYANYSTSFNPVTHLALGATTAAETSLEPERAKTYELGARYRTGGLSLEAGVFWIDFDNQIESVGGVNINTGATRHRGIETAAEYDLGMINPAMKGLSLYGTYAWTKATREQGVNSGNHVQLYSPHVATLGTRYRIDNWTLNLNAYAQSSQFADDANTVAESANGKLGTIPGYLLFNGQVAYDFDSGVTIAAGMVNILDKDYFTRASVEANGGIFAGAPRTAYIQTKFVF
ncbi:TonB-dependent receptor family protein [Ferrovibrio terrae]|nr:TonB-dependent siderophore receptor [Ferrovibrio terrae]